MEPLIYADNISKSFGKYRIINSLSLRIEQGCVYGLVGLNGAGKTTLLRLLLGILKPDSGTIRVLGRTPWLHEENLYKKCGIVLESDGFWGNLTAAENCNIYAAAKGLSSQELASYLDSFWKDSGLFSTDKKVKQFSRGQRMLCAICRAFMGNPSVFFLDEPLVALDITAYSRFKLLVENARSRGACIIISSHQLDAIDELCTRVGILRNGTIVEIDRQRKESKTGWFLDTDNIDLVSSSILQAGGENIRYDGGWHFIISDAKTRIPQLIRLLVNAGCDIREVRAEEPDLASAIRMLCTSSPSERRI